MDPASFAVGVIVGLVAPWLLLALLDAWRRRRNPDAPERLTARAREVWGKGANDAGV